MRIASGSTLCKILLKGAHGHDELSTRGARAGGDRRRPRGQVMAKILRRQRDESRRVPARLSSAATRWPSLSTASRASRSRTGLILMDMRGWMARKPPASEAAPETRAIPVIHRARHGRPRLRRSMRPPSPAAEDRGAAPAGGRRGMSIGPAAQLRHDLRTPAPTTSSATPRSSSKSWKGTSSRAVDHALGARPEGERSRPLDEPVFATAAGLGFSLAWVRAVLPEARCPRPSRFGSIHRRTGGAARHWADEALRLPKRDRNRRKRAEFRTRGCPARFARLAGKNHHLPVQARLPPEQEVAGSNPAGRADLFAGPATLSLGRRIEAQCMPDCAVRTLDDGDRARCGGTPARASSTP